MLSFNNSQCSTVPKKLFTDQPTIEPPTFTLPLFANSIQLCTYVSILVSAFFIYPNQPKSYAYAVLVDNTSIFSSYNIVFSFTLPINVSVFNKFVPLPMQYKQSYND